jgi:nucleoid-associated protein YgaU
MGKVIRLTLLFLLIIGNAFADAVQLKEGAPERYVVISGDTLWSISSRFLKDPWRWPEIWKMNKAQIRNPNRIYPGDVIVLDTSAGAPQLKLLSRDTLKLVPATRIEPTVTTAIPPIPLNDIEPFLSQPLVIEKDGFAQAARIVSTEENRVVVGAGDRAYAKGIRENAPRDWQIYKHGEALVDPDTKETLGYEAFYLGEATVIKAGDPATILIKKSTQEVNTGDNLTPAPQDVALSSFVPHAPEKSISGRVISVYGGVAEVGAMSVVTINRGGQDGLEGGGCFGSLSLWGNHQTQGL